MSDEMLGNIIRVQLGRIKKRVRENRKTEFSYTNEVVKLIDSRCTEVESGGRMIDAILAKATQGDTLTQIAIEEFDGNFEFGFS